MKYIFGELLLLVTKYFLVYFLTFLLLNFALLYNLPPILKLVSTRDCVVVVCSALAARADMASIVFHAGLLYNWRLVSQKGLFD